MAQWTPYGFVPFQQGAGNMAGGMMVNNVR